ncbi:MAG: hypothetical protein ACYS17_11040 [Planctomycetota bacterium]|jgi:hypothetical protein
MRLSFKSLVLLQFFLLFSAVSAEDVKTTDVYARIKAGIDAVSAINTHDHLMPFEKIGNRNQTDRGEGMTLRSIWAGSYFPWIHSLEPWPRDGSFDTWWSKAQHNFANARATSFYRYLLPAFQDLYGVDFDTITTKQARRLNDRIFENYKTDKWLREVITERANIELVVVDAYWARLDFKTHYPFTVALCNVTSVVRGFHPSEFTDPLDNPYEFARRHNIEINTLEDYLTVLDRIMVSARKDKAICLKSTLAYNRTLRFENVSKERAAAAFGKPRKELTSREIKDFEDFIMWRLVELSAKHNLPFQIHTGQARIQGSTRCGCRHLVTQWPGGLFRSGWKRFLRTGLCGALTPGQPRGFMGRPCLQDSAWLRRWPKRSFAKNSTNRMHCESVGKLCVKTLWSCFPNLRSDSGESENGFTKISEVKQYEEVIDSFKNHPNRFDFLHIYWRLCWCQTGITL